MNKAEMFERLHDAIAVLVDERDGAEKAGDSAWAARYDGMIDAVREACGLLEQMPMEADDGKEAN